MGGGNNLYPYTIPYWLLPFIVNIILLLNYYINNRQQAIQQPVQQFNGSNIAPISLIEEYMGHGPLRRHRQRNYLKFTKTNKTNKRTP